MSRISSKRVALKVGLFLKRYPLGQPAADGQAATTWFTPPQWRSGRVDSEGHLGPLATRSDAATFPASRLWRDPASGPDTCHGTIQPLASTDVAAALETDPATAQSVMDNPLARAVPALPLPRPPEPPEPNGGSAGPVAAVVPPSPVVTAIETPALANPVDLGQTFLAWLKQGLVSGQLPVNTVHARVHRVREGLVLVSPGIFRDYAAAAQAPWANIQKRFQKLHPANLVPYSSILL